MFPRDRRMDTSINMPARTEIPPTIAYPNMGRDKPMATSAAPKRIIQIAPIIHTIGHLLLRLCSGAGVRTICTSLEVATGLADREVNATSSTSSPGYKECILASRIFHHPFEYHRR